VIRHLGRMETMTTPATSLESPLLGTVAVVTGASSGIGEATALALAAQGASVVLVARREDRLRGLAARIGDAGGRSLAVAADVTQDEQASAAVEQTVAEFGRLDILINNAGVMLLGPVADAPVDEWQQMISINVNGLLYCTKAALPHLIEAAETSERGVADVVNMSSVAGRVPRAGSGVYNATKHGVGAFSEALRQEVARRHVRIGLVEPGATDTELASHNRAEVLEGINQRFGDLQRLEADDIAEAVVYMVTRPRHAAVNEILIRPTEQV
jgi:NADP-dependent 3-hydroxy acid dehydrogenase YdfG